MYERLKKAKDLAMAKDVRKQRDKDEQAMALSLQEHKQMQTALRAETPGATSALDASAEISADNIVSVANKVDENSATDKEGGAPGGEGGGDAGTNEDDDMQRARAADEEDEMCEVGESYEVARLKGVGPGGGRWGKKRTGRWGKKVLLEEEELAALPDTATTYQRFLHVLSRLIKGSVDSSDYEESCRITLGTSSYELFTLEWLTTQLRVLARTLVSVDDADPSSSGAPFLALSEYHWLVRERQEQMAAQVEEEASREAHVAAHNHALALGLSSEDAHVAAAAAGASAAGAATARAMQRHCSATCVEELNAKALAGPAGCYAFYFNEGSGDLTIALHLLGQSAMTTPAPAATTSHAKSDMLQEQWLACSAAADATSAHGWGVTRSQPLSQLCRARDPLAALRDPTPYNPAFTDETASLGIPAVAAISDKDGGGVDSMDVDGVEGKKEEKKTGRENVKGGGESVAEKKEEEDKVVSKEERAVLEAQVAAALAQKAEEEANMVAEVEATRLHEVALRSQRREQRAKLRLEERHLVDDVMQGVYERHDLSFVLGLAQRRAPARSAVVQKGRATVSGAAQEAREREEPAVSMTFVPHGTDCLWRPPARRLQSVYRAVEREARMAAWQEQLLAEMPVIQRRVPETSDLEIANILGRMPALNKGKRSMRQGRKRLRDNADEQGADGEEEALLLNLTSPRDGKKERAAARRGDGETEEDVEEDGDGEGGEDDGEDGKDKEEEEEEASGSEEEDEDEEDDDDADEDDVEKDGGGGGAPGKRTKTNKGGAPRGGGGTEAAQREGGGGGGEGAA